MTFLQPYLLWGIAAVAIPVAVHFWYQKKGKTIEWAAMRWLEEPSTRQHRGLRLNEIALMLLRCALVAWLAFTLSRPVMDWLPDGTARDVIHLVQPDRLVTDTYRFELENALKGGGKIYWMGSSPEAVKALTAMPVGKADVSFLQRQINALAASGGKDFRLYFRNDIVPADFPKVYIPGDYQLFLSGDSSTKSTNLTRENIAGKGTMRVLLANSDPAEGKTIRAALSALEEVYGFSFETDETKDPSKHYQWVFTNRPVPNAQPGTTYLLSGNAWQWNVPANIVQVRDTLRLAGSDLVESGRFPEWLGELLVEKLGLSTARVPLSRGQLNELFVKTENSAGASEAMLRPWLLAGFIALLIAERWLALRKTAANHG